MHNHIKLKNSKEKKTQICHWFVQTNGLLTWLSLCVLTIWYFWPFGNPGLQSPRDLPSPLIASIHHTVQCPWRNPYVNWLRALINLTWLRTTHYTYLMIEIAVIDAWVPYDDARIDAIPKKHVNLLPKPYPNKITEHKKVEYPMACCIVAKSKSFLRTWLIFILKKMNPKHAKADMIPNIPVAIRK